MGFFELFLIGVGLSMDAFAVAVCKGLNMRRVNRVHCLIIALFFGGFQAFMPLAGWVLGRQFEAYITAIDHWIAFVLLAIIGGKMVAEAFKGEECGGEQCKGELCHEELHSGELSKTEDRLDWRELSVLAVATSIDALAVGITFAFLRVHILPAVTIIGCTTFGLSVAGVFVGNLFGSRYKSRAELAGGVILILIGAKILVEHLGLLA